MVVYYVYMSYGICELKVKKETKKLFFVCGRKDLFGKTYFYNSTVNKESDSIFTSLYDAKAELELRIKKSICEYEEHVIKFKELLSDLHK